mmetsp:Transcript_13109/g.32379  ORF Transcript_13109/g.32379 Transcript_13109/m.32379 type:complete len:272 (+) Transcript_13109:460-1275(+)
MSGYLVQGDGGGAHERYRPQDEGFRALREKMAACPKRQSERLSTFLEICKVFKPVFRNFFLERFQNPSDWFHARTRYTRSMAVNSMVGYIVGLGDRHGGNILLDEKTAEVISIDLGMCFEFGKLLSTPETVPFRFTRDVIDGMGPFGKEGTFRRCSEIVMRVLRSNREVLEVVLEVFLHDPLFRWALAPLKVIQENHGFEVDEHGRGDLGEDVSLEGNLDATAALLRVREKLTGQEDQEVLDVEAQVRRLMLQAGDPKNLCMMFEGWGAWV